MEFVFLFFDIIREGSAGTADGTYPFCAMYRVNEIALAGFIERVFYAQNHASASIQRVVYLEKILFLVQKSYKNLPPRN